MDLGARGVGRNAPPMVVFGQWSGGAGRVGGMTGAAAGKG